MSPIKESTNKCYVLIAEWFAIRVGSDVGPKNTIKLNREPISIPSRPHMRALVILSELRVTVHVPQKYGYQFKCTLDKVAGIVERNIDRGPVFGIIHYFCRA